MTTTTTSYRCILAGGPAHGLVVPDVEAPPPNTIECERRDWPGWTLVYGQSVVDDDQGVARYQYVASGPRGRPVPVDPPPITQTADTDDFPAQEAQHAA